MLDKSLEKLEAKIKELEERIEEDSDFKDCDEFQTLYNELKDFITAVKEMEIEAFPHSTASEKMEELFYKNKKRFQKLELRFKSIEKEADMEDSSNDDWMFPNGRDDG